MANETVALAFQRIGVAASDDPLQPHDYAIGMDMLTDLMAELQSPLGGCTFTFTIDSIPAAYRFALATMLGSRLAPTYSRPPLEPEKTSLVRIRAINLPYVRDMDLNDDGTTTDDEIADFDRGAYY